MVKFTLNSTKKKSTNTNHSQSAMQNYVFSCLTVRSLQKVILLLMETFSAPVLLSRRLKLIHGLGKRFVVSDNWIRGLRVVSFVFFCFKINFQNIHLLLHDWSSIVPSLQILLFHNLNTIPDFWQFLCWQQSTLNLSTCSLLSKPKSSAVKSSLCEIVFGQAHMYSWEMYSAGQRTEGRYMFAWQKVLCWHLSKLWLVHNCSYRSIWLQEIGAVGYFPTLPIWFQGK